MKFCCRNLRLKINKKYKNIVLYLDPTTGEEVISYNKKWRSYLLSLDIRYGKPIDKCPWCGNNLPRDLTDEWFDILEKEYNITDPSDTESHLVPEEFKTDEWWKKRGL